MSSVMIVHYHHGEAVKGNYVAPWGNVRIYQMEKFLAITGIRPCSVTRTDTGLFREEYRLSPGEVAILHDLR